MEQDNEKLLGYTEKAKVAILEYKSKIQQLVLKIKDLEKDKQSLLDNNKSISKDISG